MIADTARAMPHTLRAIDGEDGTIAELVMIWPPLKHPTVVTLLERFGSGSDQQGRQAPPGLAVTAEGPAVAEQLIEEIFAALTSSCTVGGETSSQARR
ncbi:hypothetical protein AB0M87_32465, partial [Streptomyces sp. NPDC051320]